MSLSQRSSSGLERRDERSWCKRTNRYVVFPSKRQLHTDILSDLNMNLLQQNPLQISLNDKLFLVHRINRQTYAEVVMFHL